MKVSPSTTSSDRGSDTQLDPENHASPEDLRQTLVAAPGGEAPLTCVRGGVSARASLLCGRACRNKRHKLLKVSGQSAGILRAAAGRERGATGCGALIGPCVLTPPAAACCSEAGRESVTVGQQAADRYLPCPRQRCAEHAQRRQTRQPFC